MLRKIMMLLVLFFFCVQSQEVRPLTSGTVTQDIQFKTLDGKEYSLFEVLESGKHIYMQFQAEW